MSKKDYVIIAKAIKDSKLALLARSDSDLADNHNLAVKCVAANLATTLANNNHRFDRNRFMVACGFA